MADSLRSAFASMEQAVAEALETVTAISIGTPDKIEKLGGLFFQKKIVIEMLLAKIDLLEAYNNLVQPDSSQAEISSDPWDELMNLTNKGTNPESDRKRCFF